MVFYLSTRRKTSATKGGKVKDAPSPNTNLVMSISEKMVANVVASLTRNHAIVRPII